MTITGYNLPLVLTLSVTSGCHDYSPPLALTTKTTATTSAPPTSKVVVTLSIGGVNASRSPIHGKQLRITWDLVLTESAGVGARVNFLRQEIWNRDFDQYERSEIGVEQIPEVCGTNVLKARST